MGSGHGHGHGHSHVPRGGDPRERLRRMLISVALLASFFAVELGVGLWIGSLAMLADAGHMITDVLAMSMGAISLALARRGSSNPERTFGWHRAEVVAGLFNATLLFCVAGFIAYGAYERIDSPAELPGAPLIVVALAGLAVNLAVILLIRGFAGESLAVRGAYLEVMADALASVGVLVAGVAILLFDWAWVDTVVAVAIALWVLPRALGLARAALRILVQTAPPGVDIEALQSGLEALPDVLDVHDLHVWTLNDGMDVATVHLQAAIGTETAVLERAREFFVERELPHVTVQVESGDAAESCRTEMTW